MEASLLKHLSVNAVSKNLLIGFLKLSKENESLGENEQYRSVDLNEALIAGEISLLSSAVQSTIELAKMGLIVRDTMRDDLYHLNVDLLAKLITDSIDEKSKVLEVDALRIAEFVSYRSINK